MKTFTLAVSIALAIGLPATSLAHTEQPEQSQPTQSHLVNQQITDALSNPLREPANLERDKYRHPAETLSFFGIKPTDTVVELWPGGRWYAEILAPYLAKEGHYVAANFDANPPAEVESPAYRIRLGKALDAWLQTHSDTLGKASSLSFEPPRLSELGAANSADAVLTFRNLHNWAKAGVLEQVFDSAYQVLKPGGTFGVVEHRANPGMDLSTGYMVQDEVIALAEKAGFTLVAASEINANAKDTKDHPKGVWTLPPSLRLGEQDKDKYLAMGESDRMTLKFIKKPK
ncbi:MULTISPECIES: class I SAM-dependent methyltransferase [Shewanella]|uniref:Class I SAM-dependent methyltransferase n=1 Tax=Shewanella marisflavi TaxID=260364 RepID=A0ABX5WM05_9GAMM|nr:MULTISPECIES: class I SAM-dependent methyltransferase [Shewanella]QDF75111.1 class I SAM-dependent methyltransferase [Shewanella marisflavi]